MERIYEDEIHEHSNGIFKDVIGTESIHVEDTGYFDSLGELLRKIRTGNLGEKQDGSQCAQYVVGHKASESHIVEYVQSNIDGDASEEAL